MLPADQSDSSDFFPFALRTIHAAHCSQYRIVALPALRPLRRPSVSFSSLASGNGRAPPASRPDGQGERLRVRVRLWVKVPAARGLGRAGPVHRRAGRRVSRAGPVAPDSQRRADHEELAAAHGQSEQGRQGVRAGMRVRVHLVHHVRGGRQVPQRETQDDQRRGHPDLDARAGVRQLRARADHLPRKVPQFAAGQGEA